MSKTQSNKTPKNKTPKNKTLKKPKTPSPPINRISGETPDDYEMETEPTPELKILTNKTIQKNSNPSIITIVILSHGSDLVNEKLSNNIRQNVRIISQAGHIGGLSLSSNRSVNNIIRHNYNVFKNYNSKKKDATVSKKITEKEIKEFIKNNQLNKCENTPVIDVDDDTITPISTYTYFKELWNKPDMSDKAFKDEYKQMVTTKLQQDKKISPYTKKQTEFGLTNELVFKLYVPIVDKILYFGDKSNTNDSSIIVLDTCNYKGNIKVNDNLLTKKGDSAVSIDNNGELKLSELIEHLKKNQNNLRFEIINIIDLSCRYCNINDRDESKLNDIIKKENESENEIDKTL